MMFAFRFGYETPKQSSANVLQGWDDESSQWVVIDAPDESAALANRAATSRPGLYDLPTQSHRALV